MQHRTWIEISQQALIHNIETLRAQIDSRTRFCAVIKANAYGHGMKQIASLAHKAGVDAFAVDTIDDAILLREQYPSALIIVLGLTLHERFKEAVTHRIHLTLYDKPAIGALQEAAASCNAKGNVHLKIETGTHRQGVTGEEAPDLFEAIQASTHVTLAGLSTHFANVEDAQHPEYASLQYERFTQAQALAKQYGQDPEWIHCACSAAIILYPQTHGTLVRAGISLYGIWSSSDVDKAVREKQLGITLQPVLSWKTRVAQVKHVPAGSPIGYGLTEVLSRRSRIAILRVGYWDGYDRGLSSKGSVLIAGHRCRVIGIVCMNMIIVDVSDVPNIEKGDEVTLIGQDGRHMITADDLAKILDTIPYEIVTRINPTLPRVIR